MAFNKHNKDDETSAAPRLVLAPSRFNPSISIPKTSFGVLQGLSLVIVAAFACLILLTWLGGFLVRAVGDDYSFARSADMSGFWLSQWLWWSGYVGRWFAVFLCNVAVSYNFLLFPLIPALTLTLWGVGLYSALAAFLKEKRPALLLAIVWLGCSLALAPNVNESVFWIAALFVHTWPLALSGFGLFLLIQKKAPLWAVGIFFFFLAGCSETFDLAIVPCLVAVALWRRDKAAIVAALCFVAGMALVFLAPGNAVRAAEFSVRDRSAGHVLERSWVLGMLFWSMAVESVLRLGAVAAFVTGLSSRTSWRPRWFAPLAGLVFSVYGTVVTYAPSVYALGHMPDGRTKIATAFLVSGGVLFAALSLGLQLRGWAARWTAQPSRWMTGVALLLVLGIYDQAYPEVERTWERLNVMRVFARKWSARDQSIRAQIARGAEVVYAPAVPLISLDIKPDPAYYVNEYMAYHYDRRGRVKIVRMDP